jgi:Trypsin
LIRQGFGNLVPRVGALWEGNSQTCSGSLVGPGVVLTAAHCLYNNQMMDGPDGYLQGPFSFVPGQTALGPEWGHVPTQPYGTYYARNWWVTSWWANGDPGYDWGLILLEPDPNGNYPGTTLGWWGMYPNLRYGTSQFGELIGYPRDGIFSTFAFSLGNSQYFVDASWDQQVQNPAMSRTNNAMVAWQASMTGGVSGGVELLQLADGSYGIGGVLNQSTYCCNRQGDYYALYQYSAYFNDGISLFWHGVFG